jgi:glycerol kinase
MDVLLQFQSDLLGVPVRRSRIQESTALGAAYLAGLGEGVWSSTDELAAYWQEDRTFQPGSRADLEVRYQGWRRAVQRATGWIEPDAAVTVQE